MKRFSIVFIISLFFVNLTFSQGDNYKGNSTQETKDRLKKFAYSLYTIESYKERESKIKGSRYIPKNWTTGNIQLKNLENMTLQMKFNTVQERFEIKTTEFIYAIYAPQKIESIKFQGNSYVLKELDTDEGKKKIFVEELVSGKCCVYKRLKGTVLQPSYNSSLSVGSKSPKIYLEDYYYFDIKGKTPEEVKPKRRRVWKTLSDKKSEMKTYIKDNNLHTTNEEDLIQAINYYNKL